MEYKLIRLFPTTIFSTYYEKDFTVEKKYIEDLEYQLNGENFRTKDTYLFKHKTLKNIKKFCLKSLNEYLKIVLHSEQRLGITQCWVNKNPRGTGHSTHIHPNSVLSGVFYFNSSSPILFAKDTNTTGLRIFSTKITELNYLTFLVNPLAGVLLLFPSNTVHSVPLNTKEEMRYSLSFNTFPTDIIGNREALTECIIN